MRSRNVAPNVGPGVEVFYSASLLSLGRETVLRAGAGSVVEELNSANLRVDNESGEISVPKGQNGEEAAGMRASPGPSPQLLVGNGVSETGNSSHVGASASQREAARLAEVGLMNDVGKRRSYAEVIEEVGNSMDGSVRSHCRKTGSSPTSWKETDGNVASPRRS